MKFKIDLLSQVAVEEGGDLVVKFTADKNGYYGEVIEGGLPAGTTEEDAARIMREAGEAFAASLAASALGKLARAKTTPKKARASRANGKRGGRPKKR